ncbi:MAG: hypothetical protein FJW31_17485 [Acidobacteria bacterium]|nr:hypothetical protein [Acidobacteriota bacterium]
MSALAPAVTPEIAEVGEVAAAPPPDVEEEPYINIWLEKPVTPAPAPAKAAEAALAAEPAIPSLADLREEEPAPAPRSRIHTVHVSAADEAQTDDIAISPAAETQAQPVTALVPRPVFGAPSAPVLPQVSARPVETVEPSYDVAALGKATTDNRAGLPAGIVDSGENKLEIPPGLHEASVLSQLIENQTPFSGVVVAIGLNDYESVRERLSGGDAAGLNKMVLSMLRPQDFACRFLEDEYILVYPGERGSSAQRRLFQVSEKLWDFQLRSLGNLSVIFSWGGLELTNETLSESVASARERMYQTKRNRKPSSAADSVLGRRKVVNG